MYDSKCEMTKTETTVFPILGLFGAAVTGEQQARTRYAYVFQLRNIVKTGARTVKHFVYINYYGKEIRDKRLKLRL